MNKLTNTKCIHFINNNVDNQLYKKHRASTRYLIYCISTCQRSIYAIKSFYKTILVFIDN